MEHKRRVAYVGIGSNLGDRARNVGKAAGALRRLQGVRVLSVSPVYVSSPVGPRQRDFFNLAVKIATALRPADLLKGLQRVEKEMGRPLRRERWGPRVIDLDILLYGRVVFRGPGLVIPHPEMHRRRFVLEPMAVIAPGLRHPRLRRTMRKLRDGLRLTSPEQKVRILK